MGTRARPRLKVMMVPRQVCVAGLNAVGNSRHRGCPNRGFTLIELLIVVSIISILSAIAIPNFLEAQTRAKVARVKADMRSFATAIESYFADHVRYPPRVRFPSPEGTSGTFIGVGIVDSVNCNPGCRSRDLSVFTTPIAYITTIPVDVFENRIAPPNNLIDYYEPVLVESLRPGVGASGFTYRRGKAITGKFGWALLSVGPDGLFGAISNLGNYPPPYTTENYWRNEYDPTNGTISPGNIYRFRRNGATGNEAFHPDWNQPN